MMKRMMVMTLLCGVLGGCLNAGVRDPNAQDGVGSKNGFVSPTQLGPGGMAFCGLLAFYCVPVLAEENLRALFPKQDPRDESDPVRSTRDAVAQCRQRYGGRAAHTPQWDALETCEDQSFEQWARGSSLDEGEIQAVLQQHHALIARAQKNRLSEEEAWLAFQEAMELAVLEHPDTDRANDRIEKDWLRAWQSERCAQRYPHTQEPAARYGALCQDVAYLGWARRYGGFTGREVAPVLHAYVDLAQGQAQGVVSAAQAKERLQQAEAQALQLREKREQALDATAQRQREVAAWTASPEYQTGKRDEALQHCDKALPRRAGASAFIDQAQCYDKAWYAWGAALQVDPDLLGIVIRTNDTNAEQRARGIMTDQQAKRAVDLAVTDMKQHIAAQQRQSNEAHWEWQQHENALRSGWWGGGSYPGSGGVICRTYAVGVGGTVECMPN